MPNTGYISIFQAPPSSGQSTTGAAAAATSVVFAAAAAAQNVLQLINLSYTGAASGPITVTVSDGASVIFVTDLASQAIGTPWQLALPASSGGMAGSVNTSMTITVSAGAASSIAKLSAVVGKY
jgi:hypothetical protein